MNDMTSKTLLPQRKYVLLWGGAFALALVSVAVFFIMFFLGATSGQEENRFRLEALKIVLQFLLVTGVGGILVMVLNIIRDADAQRAQTEREAEAVKTEAARESERKRAAKAAALREMVLELGGAYRSLKRIKRRMRSQLLVDDRDPDGRIRAPYRMRIDVFEKAMTELLDAQILAEELRDRISLRSDLFEPEKAASIRQVLRYGARYFHDVFEDFERCKVRRDGEFAVIGTECSNILDFLVGRVDPSTAASKEQIQNLLASLRDVDSSDLDARLALFQEIERHRKSNPERRRFRSVATECFGIAADVMRQAANSVK